MLTRLVKPDPLQISLHPFTKTTLALISLVFNVNLEYSYFVKYCESNEFRKVALTLFWPPIIHIVFVLLESKGPIHIALECCPPMCF